MSLGSGTNILFTTAIPFEETHELIEAIDLKESKKIMEELDDVLYALSLIHISEPTRPY